MHPRIIMIAINDKEFYTLVDYMQKNYGINLIKKRTLIESRLNNYLTAGGFSDYSSFLAYALSDPTGEQLNQILNRLTTNYSYFMREWDHFQFFKDKVLPEMSAGIKDHDMRIWSAGCSTGQEPYTLAMLSADYFGSEKSRWDTKVLATDISLKALDAAILGVYDDECLKNVPANWKMNHFNKMPDGNWQVNSTLKKEVIFRRFNLIEGQFPFKKRFHVIFCRNVMIYFNDQTKRTLIGKFYNALEPGGYLFVGQSETVDRTEFHFKSLIPSVYKKVG